MTYINLRMICIDVTVLNRDTLDKVLETKKGKRRKKKE